MLTQPMKLISMTLLGISRLSKSLKVEWAATPAAKIKMSILPNVYTVKSTKAVQSSSDVTSATL